MSKQLHEMSDEELLALDPSTLVEEQPPVEETEEQVEESQAAPEQTDQPVEDVFEQETVNPTEDVTPEVPQEPVNEEPAEPQTESEGSTDVDYQSFYNVVTAPFKANGKELQINNPMDIITLMQKGANYSKKMEEMKPNLAIIKTLEQHGLLDLERLSYAIDLFNKKPEAIAKLVKESEIDLYSFDTEQAESYVPSAVVTPATELNEVIDELSESSAVFLPTLEKIISGWDEQSKRVITENPQVLRALNEHAERGIFDRVNEKIAYERMFGRMNHVPIIQAYMQLEPQFVNAQPSTQQAKPFTAPRPAQSKPVSNPNNNNNKNKAAMPSASGNNNNNNNNINPLAMSDEELLQYMHTQM